MGPPSVWEKGSEIINCGAYELWNQGLYLHILDKLHGWSLCIEKGISSVHLFVLRIPRDPWTNITPKLTKHTYTTTWVPCHKDPVLYRVDMFNYSLEAKGYMSRYDMGYIIACLNFQPHDSSVLLISNFALDNTLDSGQ